MFGIVFFFFKEIKLDFNFVSIGNFKLLEAERTGFVEEDFDVVRL